MRAALSWGPTQGETCGLPGAGCEAHTVLHPEMRLGLQQAPGNASLTLASPLTPEGSPHPISRPWVPDQAGTETSLSTHKASTAGLQS